MLFLIIIGTPEGRTQDSLPESPDSSQIRNNEWLMQEDSTVKSEESASAPLKRYKNTILDTFQKSPILITILYVVIIYSIVTMIILLIIILANRTRLEREAKRKAELTEKYQELVMDYLFHADKRNELFRELDAIASDNFTRQILIDQMIDLSINLKGEIKETIKELYLQLGLNKDSLKKAYSRKWHKNIKGFRELAFMNIRDANDRIFESLNSHNAILRMEAQIALVRLSDDNPYHFLDYMEQPFALWEQITLHELVTQHNLSIPTFDQWFQSENLSVVIFALHMASWFKQKDSEERVIQLLYHPDEEVRYHAIQVCGELHLTGSLSHLREIYPEESFRNCLEILRTFAKVPDDQYLDFLKETLDKEEDVQLQIQATKAMENTGEPGISMLIKLMKSKSGFKDYQIIIRHVLDGRIY